MPILMNIGSDRAEAFVANVGDIFDDLQNKIEPLRNALLAHGLIHAIPDSYDNPNFITVDGGVVLDQMPSIDLLASCAVSAEGMVGDNHLTPDTTPKLLWETSIKNHSAEYKSVGTKVMSLQEMILLEHEDVKNHDYRIIDGSWTSALIPVLMSMLQSNAESLILNSMLRDGLEREYFTPENVIDAITRRHKPWAYNDGTMIAIAKSDSQQIYSRLFASYGIDESLYQGLGDRIIASILLQPGEMLTPVELSSQLQSQESDEFNIPPEEFFDPRQLAGWRMLNRTPRDRQDRYHNELVNIYEEVANGGVFSTANHSYRLRSANLKQFQAESWGWTTYFMPKTYIPGSRPLKIDFLRPTDIDPWEVKQDSLLVTEAALKIAADLTLDTDSGTKEPISQYVADLAAKEVSDYVTYLKSLLMGAASSNLLVSGITGSYRT